jgi:CP family cyanate transporter-like MFS transporter
MTGSVAVKARAKPTLVHALPFLAVVASMGLMLRGPIVAVAPIAGTIRLDLGISAVQVGLLTGLPVLCFAALTPFASFLASRTGPRIAVLISIVGVGLGTIVRSAGGVEAIFIGTLLMGAFITVGNVVLPVVIRQSMVTRVGIVTGTYAAALNMGSMLTALATAPLAAAFGWQLALFFWLIFVIVAGVTWLAVLRRREPVSEHGRATPPPTVATSSRSAGVAPYLLGIAFAGQSFAYFGITAWLPSLLADEVGFSPTAAGAGASVFQFVGVAGAIAAPGIMALIGRGKAMGLIAGLWIIFLLGMMLAPHAWLAWTLVGGIAQSTGISATLTLIVTLSRDERGSRRTSALVQGIGYALGSFGPTVVGGLRDSTGAWTVPLGAAITSIVVFGVFGILATVRARRVAEIPTPV